MRRVGYHHRALRGRLSAFAVAGLLAWPAVPIAAQAPPEVTRDTIDRWMTELSNRGRWGPEDDRGTLNLITPGKRLEAAGLVTDGVSVSLSHDYLTERSADFASPLGHEVTSAGEWVVDRLDFSYHGHGHTHLDAVCHLFHDGRMYNDFVREEVVSEDGCARGGVDVAREGIVSRGVLMDIARLKGVEYIEPGTPVTVADLEAWEARTGMQVGVGDILLVRAGRWARRAETGPWALSEASVGLHASVAPWLRERGVAMLGNDYANDHTPQYIEGVSHPVHQLALVAMGMPLLDNLDLEGVAREAAARGRWEFLLVLAPLRVAGGTGSPVNPIAIF